jgi:hypothetical protein
MGENEEIVQLAIGRYARELRHGVMQGVGLEESYEQLLASIRTQFARHPDVVEEQEIALKEALRLELAQRDRVSYWRKAALKAGRPDWYGGADEGSRIWQALRRRLKEIGRSEDEIESIDMDSTAVLSLTDNPGQARFTTKGLVLGHVQSGKTGNMAAVIAKAADTPYRFFVILSGLTDSLRNQTQARLDADLVDNGHRDRWYSWTQIDRRLPDGRLEKGDFNHRPGSGFPLAGPECHIAVMKKNAAILRRFKRMLRATPSALLAQTAFMIIDDECDQASVNSARLQASISATNRVIREIVAMLPKVAYVGYTATPFANILIDPNEPQDLYPRDFIHPLMKPDAYFGAEELFGRKALQGEDADIDSGYNMIRIVGHKEISGLRPAPRQAATFAFEMTDSISAAIRYFILALAARIVRGQQDQHSTMLIHTSMLNVVHLATQAVVEPYLQDMTRRLKHGDESLFCEMEQLWDDESEMVDAAEFGNERVPFAKLRPLLAGVSSSIEIKVENWRSEDRIDYSEPGRRYIVIGGNVLARGLTLSGLIVSFFMRTSSQYDTLMQMGRWFGFRPGYADLPRVWMEEDVRDAFFDLATVEEEIRRDIDTYAIDNVTPIEFAARVRKIPGLAITARTKLRNVRTASIGFEGEHVQTIKFRRSEKDVLDPNWDAGHRLLEAAADHIRIRGNRVTTGVPASQIERFLDEYHIEEGRTLQSRFLLAYIRNLAASDPAGRLWNVATISGNTEQMSERPLGPGGRVACVTRNPLKNSGEMAFVKAIMSRSDILADVENAPAELTNKGWKALKEARYSMGMPPLLVLYPIYRDSHPKIGSDREPMNAATDVLGFGIVFPGKPGSGTVYVQADIPPLESEEDYEGENAIPEELIDGS